MFFVPPDMPLTIIFRLALSCLFQRTLRPKRISRPNTTRNCATRTFAPLNESSFNDPKVFVGRPTSQLLFNYAILRSCSITPLVTVGTAAIKLLELINLAGTSKEGNSHPDHTRETSIFRRPTGSAMHAQTHASAVNFSGPVSPHSPNFAPFSPLFRSH